MQLTYYNDAHKLPGYFPDFHPVTVPANIPMKNIGISMLSGKTALAAYYLIAALFKTLQREDEYYFFETPY